MPKIVTSYPAVLGAVLQSCRKKGGRSQGDIANGAGVNTSTWSRIENGETAMTVEQLIAACAELGITPSNLLKEVQSKIEELQLQGIDVINRRKNIKKINDRNNNLIFPIVGTALAGLMSPISFGVCSGAIAISAYLSKKNDLIDDNDK